MKIELTCPKCGQSNNYSDRDYKSEEEFEATPNETIYNMVVCKDCGFNFEFSLYAKEVELNKSGLWPRVDEV